MTTACPIGRNGENRSRSGRLVSSNLAFVLEWLARFAILVNAGPLVADLLNATDTESKISPLRHVRVLRILARYYSLVGETDEQQRCVAEAHAVAMAANPGHQHRLCKLVQLPLHYVWESGASVNG